MTENHYDIVVVGASVASEAFIRRLRELDYAGSILAVDRDDRMPYERPPLSKLFMTRPEDTSIDIDWDNIADLQALEAINVDIDSQSVKLRTLHSNDIFSVSFDLLVIASGASPVRLPEEPENLYRLRTAGDADRIRVASSNGERVGIIGAGAIGCELASSLNALGAHATLIDKADRPLERLLVGHLGYDVTSWLQNLGIECFWGAEIEDIGGVPGDWSVALTGGQLLKFDVLISAVGVIPTVEWLRDSELLDGGTLICDDVGRVFAPSGRFENIYAIGDVVTRLSLEGAFSRTESWSAAVQSGVRLAQHIMHEPLEGEELPYFWTDVAGRKVQVLGVVRRDGAIQVEYESTDRGAILYKVTSDDGTQGWIGINAQPQIAKLRMAYQT